jgi:predicted CoA-binding protein
MKSKAAIENFLNQKSLAVVGVSRSGKKFGNTIFKELSEKGYTAYPVNPLADKIDGQKCYHNIEALPDSVKGVVFVVPPTEMEKLLPSVAKKGIKHVWMQQGAGSRDAVRFCQKNHIECVNGQCLLMFAEPVTSFHKFHRFIWKLLGKI